MLKRIFDFLSSLWKAVPILIVIGAIFISSLIGLRDKLFSTVELPLIVLLVLGVLALYPLLKLVQWILLRKKPEPVQLYGLAWKPSRWSFQYPTPICPRCGCTIHYREEPQLVQMITSPADVERANRSSVKYIYECPNCGPLPVENRRIDHLQRLASAKLRG